MRILVTNDDGIHSPGLTALAKALSKVGEVWVVAPDRERTAVAHAVTLHKPLRVQQLGTRIYAVNGTPVDCVNLAVLKLLPAPPDLLVSGINKGAATLRTGDERELIAAENVLCSLVRQTVGIVHIPHV